METKQEIFAKLLEQAVDVAPLQEDKGSGWNGTIMRRMTRSHQNEMD